MKIKLVVLAFLLAMGGSLFAQNPTAVSGTITDPNGVAYYPATVTACLTPVTTSPIVNGQHVNPNEGTNYCAPLANTSSTGFFSLSLFPNSAITPGGTQWRFTVTAAGAAPPSGKGSQTFQVSITISGTSQDVGATLTAASLALLNSGGVTTTASIPGTPGLTAVPVTSGLMAEYRMLPTESCSALVDYSGNGNVPTGTTGVAPTIIAGSGGCNFTRNGAIQLPASFNAIQSVQIFFQSGGFSGGLLVGNGAQANSSGFFLVNPQPTSSADGILPTTNALRPLTTILTGGFGAYSHSTVSTAPQSMAWVMDCASGTLKDRLYLGAVENPIYYTQARCLAGNQTVGNYQLGGISTSLFGDSNSWFSGNMYYFVAYNRVLTPQEVASNALYMSQAMAKRGVNAGIFNTAVANVNQFVADGDSITGGPVPTNVGYAGFLTLAGGPWNLSNAAQSNMAMDNLVSLGPFAVDPLYWPNSQGNVVAVWGGTNNNPISSAEPSLQAYCTARRLVGWKCLVVTMVSRVALDAQKNTYNIWIRQHWTEFSDGLIDIAADPSLGADGASANTTYFISGGIHPTQNSINNDEVPVFQRAVNRLYGNNDFSTATTYVAAALAATATTALTESTNTVTVTFGATPANCVVGSSIVIAGVTPAGYNSTAANGAGNGSWNILTRSATQVTYFNATTGLGAASVQGTGVCPQQQDVDRYQILNFGAGNFTLESCVGYTGQNIYIRNINAAGTTLVPFGTETITGGGATPTTIAAATTAILQSQLVSSAAAGCNWVRLQ